MKRKNVFLIGFLILSILLSGCKTKYSNFEGFADDHSKEMTKLVGILDSSDYDISCEYKENDIIMTADVTKKLGKNHKLTEDKKAELREDFDKAFDAGRTDDMINVFKKVEKESGVDDVRLIMKLVYDGEEIYTKTFSVDTKATSEDTKKTSENSDNNTKDTKETPE